uniref:BIG2 domain-containing protein n=1 Tax=Salarias fasciatus TaxID=181472 RepID=A0A672IWR9_SALFA
MNLKLKAASAIVTLKPVVDSAEHDTAVFLVKGLSVGQTTLSASVVGKSGRKITSAPQQIEVFPPFKLIPRKMTLLIGSMMQITSEGGPQPQSNILFSISEEEIASVSPIGHVRGNAVGNVTVTGLVQAIDAETGKLVVVSQDQVEVEVVVLTAIRIRAPITRMKTGSEMPVYVMGLTNSQTPFSFGSALPSLTFHWSTTKRGILDVQPRHVEANVELQSEHNFGMRVTGKSRGRTGLKVVLRVTDPKARQLVGNLQELQDEIQIQVYDKLHMLNPKVETEELLMAPNSVLKLQTNRDGVGALSYRMLDCPDQLVIAEVDDKGLLFAGSLTGTSSLLITSQETFGVNQTLIVAVKVVPVSYVRFTTSPALYTQTKENLKAFPLGVVLTFAVHFHASTGETLHSSNSLLTFSTNRDDLVQVGVGPSNHTLTVTTINVGLTLLAAWDRENTGVADYVPIPVDHAISMLDVHKLVVGDVVCFHVQLSSPDGVLGTWSSSANGVLQVDPKTGAAVARDSGTVTVFYEIPGTLKTYREVCNTPPVTTPSALPVSVCSPGLYACSMTLQLMTDQQTRVLSISMTNLLVKGGLEGSAFSGEQVGARLPIELGLYSDQTELLLSNLQPSAELTVFGPLAALSSMKVRPSDGAEHAVRHAGDNHRSLDRVQNSMLSGADPPPVVNWDGGHSLHSFINCYQMMFCTLFALLAGTAILIIGGSRFSSRPLIAQREKQHGCSGGL